MRSVDVRRPDLRQFLPSRVQDLCPEYGVASFGTRQCLRLHDSWPQNDSTCSTSWATINPSTTPAELQQPPKWGYQQVPERRRLYDVTAAVMQLRKQAPAALMAAIHLQPGGCGERINLQDSTMNVNVIGNWDVVAQNGIPNFPHTGTWYEYFTADSVEVLDPFMSFALEPGEYRIYTDVKLQQPSITLGEEEWVTQAPLQVYPNPASDAALVVSPTSGVLRVMDLQGRELFQVQVEANIPLEVDLTAWPRTLCGSNGGGNPTNSNTAMSQRTRSFGVPPWSFGSGFLGTAHVSAASPPRSAHRALRRRNGAFNLWAAPAVKGFTLAELDALSPRTFLLGTNGPWEVEMKGRATVRTTSFMERHCGRLRPSSFRR